MGETMGVMAIIGLFVIIIGLLFMFDVWLFFIILDQLAVNWLVALPTIVVLIGVNMLVIGGLLSWV